MNRGSEWRIWDLHVPMPLANWALISQQLAIKFGDRYEIM